MKARTSGFSIFVSSVQKELEQERRAVKDYILGDPLFSRFITDVFLFEDIPARDRRPDDVYLSEVEGHGIYLGIFGYRYGWKNADGVSPTELEFNHATLHNRERLIFVKGSDDSARDEEMAGLVKRAGAELMRRRFADTPSLLSEVRASLVDFLEEKGALKTEPFDESACGGATLDDIDEDKLISFVKTAKQAGRLALKGNPEPREVLQHLNLISGGLPTNSAVLLFGRNPDKFFHYVELHCLHFPGTGKIKPILSQQIYHGTLFEIIDDAVEFVSGRLSRRVGTRATSAKAPVSYEIPHDAFAEGIVNAVAHRDYRRKGFVQVIVFADRVEVWNPGELPPGLTPELLKKPHGPIPRNPLIAEALFRAHYIEKEGTGTTDMVAECSKADLPEPDFRQDGPNFVVTLWRDWLTDDALAGLEINERQRAALAAIKVSKRTTNTEYQQLTKAIKKTASRDLDDLVRKGVLKKVGTTGRGTFYVLAKKGDLKGTKGTPDSKGTEWTRPGKPAAKAKGTTRRQTGHASGGKRKKK